MMNRVSLIGRLTKAPDVRYTSDNNLAIGRFTLAVDRTYKREGQPTADFIPIVVFGKPAENAGKYLGKGRLVGVSGRIQTRSWEDQDGKKRYVTEVIADEVNYLDKDKGSSSGNNVGADPDFHPVDEPEDDLPF